MNVIRATLLALLTAASFASAQTPPELEAFTAAVPQLRARIAAQDWEGLTAAAQPFAALRPDLMRRSEADDLLNALRDLGALQKPPTDGVIRGVIADSFGEWAIADACYQEHIVNGTQPSWSVKSGIVGYRARLAVHRGDLDLAQRLLVDQRERLHAEAAVPEPVYVAAVDAHLRAVRQLAAAPADPWQRLAFVRAYWRTSFPPVLATVHAVHDELERLLAEPAVQRDRTLLLAIRCEQLADWPSRDDKDDPRALAIAVACVDGGLLPFAAKRRDVADPWLPLLTMGGLLQRAKDPTRAMVAYDALLPCPATQPLRVLMLHEALVAGAECTLERGDGPGAVARLDRAEHEFPFQSGCGTCNMGEAARIVRLRERARAISRR
jgi:hypothetical protein